ncbi:MAG: class I tRNA ligase family protein [Polyangiaceae bacterium]|nr:class I tRNA ligase family protein [Polyangiaceae bacterium]
MSEQSFPEVRAEIDFPTDEERTLAFWRSRGIFEKTLASRAGSAKGPFVFYEGPPTANGLPHNGHVLTRVMKDLFPRYRTMRGYHVPRKAGWDTHGLPVEVEVEKELRIHGKAAIEQYGVEPFTAKCIESVFRYTSEWERHTERIGFWVDLEDAYVTYHRGYVESVWWALADLFRKGLLYRGHTVVWWWAQGGTALSSAEVGLGYRTVDDPSAYVAFPLADGSGYSLLAWTTTPWTLPSNVYAAVNPAFDYVFARIGDRKLIGAPGLLLGVAKKLKAKLEIDRTVKGAELVGLRYTPPFDVFSRAPAEDAYWTVLAADFVTLDSGTGVVHIAPAFGADDFEAHKRRFRDAGQDPPAPPCAVAPDGTFTADLPAYAGRWVKSCDDEICQELKARGLLLLKEQVRHDYPFCWRSDDDALIQYARPAWYIRTTAEKTRALANNQAIDWHPEHIREGRFGDFLRNNVDWALSRERYWGTPLPVWINDDLPEDHPRRAVVIDGLSSLRDKPRNNLAEVERELAEKIDDPAARTHLLVHKPWIDRVTFEEEGVAGTYRRVPEVIDCWFDSGCMPFAQWGFPHREGSLERLREAFPADFISEAIDQTRGWFYSLLMVSTLVFDDDKRRALGLRAGGDVFAHPYKTCILLGHVCDKEGKKESKSKGNYTPPEVILDRVQMDFAVLSGEPVAGAKAEAGTAFIAREDLEGLDLDDGATVTVSSPATPERSLSLSLRALPKLRRRVVLLADADRAALGVVANDKGTDVRPVEVPSVPADQRVTILDPATPAPGADAFRWFFYAGSPPWTNTRHSLGNVRALQKDFQIKLRNVLTFFTIYANIDGWRPDAPAPAPAARPLLCRWILSELELTKEAVTAHLDAFEAYEAAGRLTAFVESLSNWYVRRSRERFWAAGAGDAMGDDKRAAYATLHRCLTELAKLSAPFVPFFAEELYQSLVVAPGVAGARESVHLEDYPEADASLIDRELSEETEIVREIVSLGLQVRTNARLKVRQPLERVELVLSRADLCDRVQAYASLITEELNTHELSVLRPGEEGARVSYKLKPNFRALGPKVGKKVQRVKQALESVDAGAVRASLALSGAAALDVDGETITLGPEEIDVSVEAAPGYAAAGGKAGVVVLETTLTPALLDEGLAREIQSRLSAARKEQGLSFTDRVLVRIGGSARVRAVVDRHAASLQEAVLATALTTCDDVVGASFEIDGEAVVLDVKRA